MPPVIQKIRCLPTSASCVANNHPFMSCQKIEYAQVIICLQYSPLTCQVSVVCQTASKRRKSNYLSKGYDMIQKPIHYCWIDNISKGFSWRFLLIFQLQLASNMNLHPLMNMAALTVVATHKQLWICFTHIVINMVLFAFYSMNQNIARKLPSAKASILHKLPLLLVLFFLMIFV